MLDNYYENLGYVYISEETSLTDKNPVDNLVVYNSNGVFYIDFDTILHSFGVINRNQRMYMAENIWECILTEKIQSLLADNAWFGEMDHPMQVTKNDILTPERIQSIWMPNRSHKIMRPEIKGNLLHAHIQTASGTEAGVGMAKEIIQGLHPAFSCRAIAFIQMRNGKPVVVVKRLITYDWVLYPSHKEAHATTAPTVVNKQFKAVTESSNDIITSKDVMIPLKEILESVGKKDPNINAIMESFDLDISDLVGFDESKTHAIIKDKDNMIYAKINPKTVHEVKDFFRSF